MQNILIWIDASIKLEKKIKKLNSVLSHKYKNIIFVSKDKRTKNFYLKQGFSIFSMEEINEKLNIINSIEYDEIFSKDIDQKILKGVINFSSYKENSLPFPFNRKYRDPYSQIAILKKFWVLIFKEMNITDVLILNGISINAFSLAISAYLQNKKIYFWENGLLPNSLFINRSGVNAFANIDINDNKEINQLDFSNLDDFLFSLFHNYENYKTNILVTLQVDSDSNIKCFSPFFGVNEFLLFIAKFFNKKKYFKNNLRIRSHPKFKLNRKFLASIFKKNIQISSYSLKNDFEWADFVFTINSTTGLEAIINNKFLICFGNSYYSKFLRYINVNYEKKKLKIFIFDPKNKKDREIKKKLMSALEFNSLKIEKSDNRWLEIFKKLDTEDTRPYFTNSFFSKFLYNQKFANFSKEKGNLFIIKKIFFKLSYKISQLFETFY